MVVSQNYGYVFGGPQNKDSSILGSKLGFPHLRETAMHSQALWSFELGV